MSASVIGHVLVVEDDAETAHRLQIFLSEHGFEVTVAGDGRAALAVVEQGPCDILLLDLGLPGMTGLEVLRSVRGYARTPVIVVTSKQSEGDVVLALEMGADDFVVKPYRSQELLARMRAVLRRSSMVPPDLDTLTVDPTRRLVYLRGQAVDLSSTEFDLLVALMSAPGRVLDRAALLRRAGRGAVHLSQRNVDVHVSRLRHKLEDDPKHPRIIKTVHGRGYVFVPPDDHDDSVGGS